MGVTRTTYHIRNRNHATAGEGNNYYADDKRLVVIIEDVFSGLSIEKAVLLKVLIETWLRTNGVITN